MFMQCLETPHTAMQREAIYTLLSELLPKMVKKCRELLFLFHLHIVYFDVNIVKDHLYKTSQLQNYIYIYLL